MFSRKLLLALLVTALLPACGRKEPPQPPPSKIPAPISDFEVHQRGQDLVFIMSYPSVTLGGLPIEELESIEIWRMSRILGSFVEEVDPETAEDVGELTDTELTEPGSEEPEVEELEAEESEEEEEVPEASLFSLPTSVAAAEEEEDEKESLIQVTGRDFAAVAKPVWRVEREDLDSAVIGDQIILRVPLDKLVTSKDEEEILVLAARANAIKKRASPFSNLEKIYPRVPPAAPADLSVEATPDGVLLEWEVNEEALGYRVYRRPAKVRDYGEPLYLAREGLNTYTDRTAIFGDRYIYTVTSVGNLSPVVESAIVAEHEVDYKDRFPPNAPTEVVALAETGRVRLLWQASTSEDTQGYWIYRQDPGGEFQVVNEELVVGSEYLDRELASGMTYRYYLLAIDGQGNQSEASEEIDVRVP